jgi:hypothetical protein
MWLLLSPPEVVCSRRRDICTDFLDQPSEDLDINFSVKFRKHYLDDLTECGRTGILSFACHAFLKDWAMLATCDTAEMEGLNNTVKRVGLIAPHMRWDLLAARVTIKKGMANLTSIEDRDAFLGICVESHNKTLAFERASAELEPGRQRFDEPDARHFDCKLPEPPQHVLGASRRCAARIIAKLKAQYKEYWKETMQADTEVLLDGVVQCAPQNETHQPFVLWCPSPSLQWWRGRVRRAGCNGVGGGGGAGERGGGWGGWTVSFWCEH